MIGSVVHRRTSTPTTSRSPNQQYNYAAAVSFLLGLVIVVVSYAVILLTANRTEPDVMTVTTSAAPATVRPHAAARARRPHRRPQAACR